jgi:hypothetical protein
MKLVAAFTLTMLFGINSASADEIVIEVAPRGSQQPERVLVVTNDKTTRLSYQSQTTLWQGKHVYQVPEQAPSTTAELVLEYANLSVETFLPIRLTKNVSLPEIRLAFPPKTECSATLIDFIEASGGPTKEKIDKYVQARLLAKYDGPTKCGTDYLRRAELAWFYRSQELSISTPYIAFDQNAADAAKKHLSSDFIEKAISEVRAHEIRLLNIQKARLAGANKLDEAIEVNDKILVILKKDPDLAKSFEQNQRYTIDKLEADGNWYKTLSAGRAARRP